MPKSKKKLGTPPQEISQNLVHQEGPRPIDGRSLRRSPRTRQFSMRITDELYEVLYSLAKEEKLMLTQIAEIAIREYAERKHNPKKKKESK